MSTTKSTSRGGTARTAAAGLLLVGLALTVWAAYQHVTIAGALNAGQCNGCAPGHPLLVGTPAVVGVVALAVGGYLTVTATR